MICGEVDDDLQLRDIGRLVHSRWLTVVCRTFRLYTATENPSKSSITLAQFCLKVYFPAWFEIEHYSKLMCESKNFFNLSQRIVSFPNQKVVKIALKVLRNNGFFANPGSILLGMLGDEDEDLRKMAINKLCCLRLKGPSYRNENDNIEEGFIEQSSISTKYHSYLKIFYTKIQL